MVCRQVRVHFHVKHDRVHHERARLDPGPVAIKDECGRDSKQGHVHQMWQYVLQESAMMFIIVYSAISWVCGRTVAQSPARSSSGG